MATSSSSSSVQAVASAHPDPQITVLDTGGQYTHLIARRIRELGVYADVQPSDTPAKQLRSRKGVIISGGPASVYEAGSPAIDPDILHAAIPILGICYGHQLIAHHLGGAVAQGNKGEYGAATLLRCDESALWTGISDGRIWMSHRDTVQQVPPGFIVTAQTEDAHIAAMADGERRLFGLQFHPEVVHTENGTQILRNFLFDVCEATVDWDVSGRLPQLEQQIRSAVGNRNVFFFVSGGVDSTVAFTLCLRALGADRVYGMYVDTGLMREGETEFVQRLFTTLGAEHFQVERAEAEFAKALNGLYDPEEKRLAIGEQFVKVQERVLQTERFLTGDWILGQGTIYPDTIESGGTAKADLIKTHHNRVAGIQALMAAGRIIEPLTSFYKDEVRVVGQELGIPDEFLHRHPFPGPGLAIRCLCSRTGSSLEPLDQGFYLPVKTVGVQGDSRSYRGVLALPTAPDHQAIAVLAPALTNRLDRINRVVAVCGSKTEIPALSVFEAALSPERLNLLRKADAIVRRHTLQAGFDSEVWQLPVILIPVGLPTSRESVVLRPVHSLDGMTADVVLMKSEVLTSLTEELLQLKEVASVFYDLTHKPPGTIEWE